MGRGLGDEAPEVISKFSIEKLKIYQESRYFFILLINFGPIFGPFGARV